jgi:hypothetical protein
MVMGAGRRVVHAVGRLSLWLLPLTIVFEWVGGTFPKSPLDRALYFALFLGLFWLAPLAPTQDPEASRDRSWIRLLLGVPLVVSGAGLAYAALRWVLPGPLGLTPLVPPEAFTGEHHRLLAPIVAAWPLAIGLSLVRERSTSARAYEQLGLWVALAFLLHLRAGVVVQGLPVLPGERVAIAPYVLAVITLVLLGLVAIWRGPFALRLGLVLASGFAFRLLGLETWEIDPRVRDMLALVTSAQDRFAAGENPYTIYAMQHGSELPLTYFPGLWLGYGIPRLVGLDLRWMGPLAEVGFFALIGALVRELAMPQRAWAQALVTCFAAVWLFSPSAQWNAIYAEPTLWWALLGTTLALTYAQRFVPAAIALGLAVATRHFAIVLAPFLLLFFVRTRGLRAGLPLVAWSGSIAALLLTPFVVLDPATFWFGTFRWLREYGPAHLDWFFDRYGFVLYFHQWGALERMALVQWGVVLLCLALATFVRRTRIAALQATAQLAFITLNVLIWDSFLLDGAMAALCVVATRPLAAREQVAPLPTARVVWLSRAALLATVCAGAFLAFSLMRSLAPRGEKQAHDHAVRSVKEGDLVIDRSDWRLAFVTGSWLLRREEVPAPIGQSLYDGSWGGGPALHAKGRMWAITQRARDATLREHFVRLGRAEPPRIFGDYQVDVVAPHAMRLAVLAAAGPGVSTRHCRVGTTNWPMTAVEVAAGQPRTVRLRPEALGEAMMIAGGFSADQVVWPRKPVTVRLTAAGEPPLVLEVDNRTGVQWRTANTRRTAEPRELTIEVSTDDEVARTVCLELLLLDKKR